MQFSSYMTAEESGILGVFCFGYDLLQFGVLVLLFDTDYLTLGVDYVAENCFSS